MSGVTRVPLRALVTVLAVGLLLLGMPAPARGDSPPPSPTVVRALSALPTQARTLTEPVRAPIPFSMVGFRLPEGGHVEVRTSEDGRTWTKWAEVDPLPADEGPDPDSAEPQAAPPGEAVTAPVWTGAARWLQLRTDELPAGDIRPVLVDSLGLGRSVPERAWDALRAAWRPAPAAAAAGAPEIVTRAEWGADESLRSGSPSYARRVRAGFVHHTVNANTYSEAEAAAVVRGIYRYHTASNGWSDIGYNFLVDRFGTVYEGRAGGMDRGVIGAHAGGFNTGTFGVASIGTHSTEGPSSAALEAIARVIAWKFDIHHIDVAGAVELRSGGSTRYAKGTVVRLATVSGHRAVSTTSCPGNSLEGVLPDIRHRVLELGGGMILDHEGLPLRARLARGRPVDGPIRFSARLRPPGAWSLEVRDPLGRVVHTEAGEGDSVASTWTPQLGSRLGRYDWTISSPQRTVASDWVEFVLPEIASPSAAPALLRGGRDGGFAAPLRVTAKLWPQAAWTLTVTSPDGRPAHTAVGVGEAVDTSWSGRAGLAPGAYKWKLEADDATPASGAFEVLWPVLSRAGAGDAPAASVALSRAAFPSAGEAEHAVLARADVFPDAMAGGPLAGKRGPVLLTQPAALDQAVRAELERVLPAGRTVWLLGGEAALSPAVEAALGERWRVVRLAGAGRAETAARVAHVVLEQRGPGGRVLVARAGPDGAVPWADALAGGAYGAATGTPVLLTDTDRLSPAAADVVRRHAVAEAIVLGGPAAVSDAVLQALPAGRRVAGTDRAGTAVAVAESLWGRTAARDGDRVVVGNGYASGAWALALAASPLAARRNAPLLLVDREALPAPTRDHLTRLGYAPNRVAGGWLLGAEASIGERVGDEVMRLLQ
jgi:putative cell wall-binding protein